MPIARTVDAAGPGRRDPLTAKGFLTYLLGGAVITAALYTAGYSTAGFGLLFFGAVWALLRARRLPWHRTAVDVPLAAFGAVLLLSAAVSPYRALALGRTLMLIISGAIYFGSFTWLLRRDPAGRGSLLMAWAAGGLVATVLALANGALLHARAQIPRGVGPNGLGTTLLLASLLSTGLAIRGPRAGRWGWIAIAGICVIGLLATESRASLIGWAAGAAYLAWRELRSRPRRMAAVFAGGALALMVAVAASPSFARRFEYVAADVSHNRARVWRTSVVMFRAHPVLGTGFGTFGLAYVRAKQPDDSSEPFAFNLWLNIAVETGALGFAAAVAAAVAASLAWRRDGRRPPPEVDPMRPAFGAMWVGLLVSQLADNTLFSIATSAGLWLLLALTVVPVAGQRTADDERDDAAGVPRGRGGEIVPAVGEMVR